MSAVQTYVLPLAALIVVVICLGLALRLQVVPGKRDENNINIRRSRRLVGGAAIPSGGNLAEARSQLQDLLSLIYNRYELSAPEGPGRQFLLTANNMEAEAWDLLKYKFSLRLLQNNTGNDYLMIFGGSSVTASHDNYYNQSYPATVEKRLGPIFSTLGIRLVVHNIAMGANNCLPYQLCYESMGGLDPEFVGWEQSYNCGHDEPVFELAARVAAFSRKKGVVYYSASGAWAPGSCPPSTDKVPYSNEDWTPAVAGLAAWKPTVEDVQKEKTLLDKYAKAKSSSIRFHPFTSGGQYKAVAPLGFNVWEGNPLCKSRDKDDTKDITGCNGIDAAQGCKLHFMTKEAAAYGSDNGRGANWHPTRAFHMLRGEMIAWLWGLAMLDAVNSVEADLAKGTAPDALRKTIQGKLDALQPPLPPPKKCQTSHCEARPTCYTDFKPHYSANMTLRELVVGTTAWTFEPGVYFVAPAYLSACVFVYYFCRLFIPCCVAVLTSPFSFFERATQRTTKSGRCIMAISTPSLYTKQPATRAPYISA